jgi:uncharacterized membrane protein
MAVLGVLAVSTLLARGAGAIGLDALDSWPAATRAGLAVMLLFTASAHFTSMRSDLEKMVPPWIRNPRAVIVFTGICEILGAIGLLLPRTRLAAAVALIAFFVAVFPANVRADRRRLTQRGKPATPLWLRAPKQALFILLTWWSGIHRP